jgi:hypothetical protein
MNDPRLDELMLLAAGNSLTEEERQEINQILREDMDARAYVAKNLYFESMLVDCLKTQGIINDFKKPDITPLRKPHYFARAAAWIGAFLFLTDKSQAATVGAASITKSTINLTTITLLMKKSLTSVTLAILILGGAGSYAVHQQNTSAKQRVTKMESEIKSLSDQLGIKSSHRPDQGHSSSNLKPSVDVLQLLAIFDDHKITRGEKVLYDNFQKQLLTMDAEALKNMLLDAEKISAPVNGHLASEIMKQLINIDPAQAAEIGTLLCNRSNTFNYTLATDAAKAFATWLLKDPTAADQWYRQTLASGGLRSTSIPPNGLEEYAIDRSFERLRFQTMVKINPNEAESMLATMLPRDVTAALKNITEPEALRKILPKLQPEQRSNAATGVVEEMATNDPQAAYAWTRTLGMPTREADTLMAGSLKDAVANGKLDLPSVAEWAKKLDVDPSTRSKTLVDSAVSASRVPGDDAKATDWNRTSERIDWLRKEISPESADRMVGEYLGKLAYDSRTPDQSFKAYEAEIARRGNPDPALTISFASRIGIIGPTRFSDQALKYLYAIPPSPERDNAIDMIKLNR